MRGAGAISQLVRGVEGRIIVDIYTADAQIMRMKNAQRKSTNISLSADIVREAKELGVNISRASEQGVVAEISAKRKEKWLAENRPKIEAWNEWVDTNGLPLAEYRQF